VKFYAELQLLGSGPLDEARFDALADALYDLDASDPEIEDMDVTASLAERRVTVSMTADTADPAAAGTKILSTLRAAIHAIGDRSTGWEAAHSVMRVAPADEADRLLMSA